MYLRTSNPTVIVQRHYNHPINIMPSHIKPIEGILIQEPYEPEKGDPVVIEEAVFRGEVVKMGSKHREVIG